MPACIFISHAHADQDTAERLSRDLQQRGFTLGGSSRTSSTRARRAAKRKMALEQSTIFLALLSPAWVSSKANLLELQLAIDLHKPIVPIMLQQTDISALPKIERYIDLVEQPYPAALARVIKLVNVIHAPAEIEAAPDQATQPQRSVNRSGGATINADTVNIYGDVVGRDKRVNTTAIQRLLINRRVWLAALCLLLLVVAGYLVLHSNADSVAAQTDPTPTITITASVTPSPTVAPTATSTSAPTITPTPEPTRPPSIAQAQIAAAIFMRPESGAPQVGSVAAQKFVTLTGRSAIGNWYYIQSIDGLRGFVYAPYFDWSGDFKSLPIITAPIESKPTPIVTPRPIDRALMLDFYPLDSNGYCNSDGFPAYQLFMRGQGASGPFTYYIGNQIVGSSSDQLIYAYVFTQPGQTFITGRVTVDDGRAATQTILLSRPICASIGKRLIDVP